MLAQFIGLSYEYVARVVAVVAVFGVRRRHRLAAFADARERLRSGGEALAARLVSVDDAAVHWTDARIAAGRRVEPVSVDVRARESVAAVQQEQEAERSGSGTAAGALLCSGDRGHSP